MKAILFYISLLLCFPILFEYPLFIRIILFFLYSILFFLILWAFYQTNLENKEWRKLLEKLTNERKQQVERTFCTLLDDFFEGSQIKNYIIHLDRNKGLIIKIGDDSNLVEVDMSLFEEDCFSALEKAHIEWISEIKEN